MVQPTSLTKVSPGDVMGSHLELGNAVYVDVNPQFNLQTSSGLLLKDAHAIMFGSIYNLLVTPPNDRSRIFQDDYSCGLMGLIQEPLDNSTAILIEMAVKQALDRWEPRVNSVSVRTAVDVSLPGYVVRIRCSAPGLPNGTFSANFQFQKG